MKIYLQNLTKILLILFIFITILRQYQKTQSTSEFSTVQIDLFLADQPFDCIYFSASFSVLLPDCKRFQLGQRLRLIGRVDPQSDRGIFSKKRFMIQDIVPLAQKPSLVEFWFLSVMQQLKRLKTTFLKQVIGLVTPPVSGLVGGMIFGGYDGLSVQVYHFFKTIGMLHIVAASGYNVGVVIGLASPILRPLRSQFKVVAMVGIIWIYYFLADQAVSVLRAAAMATYGQLTNHLWKRQYRPLYALGIFLGLVALVDASLLTDLSLVLSVSSTIGIITCMPVFSRSPGVLEQLETFRTTQPQSIVPRQETTGLAKSFTNMIRQVAGQCSSVFRESFQVTMAAQSLTLPITLAVFQEFNVVSIIANTVLLWMTPLLTMGGIVLIGLGLVVEMMPGWLASLLEIETRLAGAVVAFGGNVLIAGTEWFSQFDQGMIYYQPEWWGLIGWYGLWAGFLWFYYHSGCTRRE